MAATMYNMPLAEAKKKAKTMKVDSLFNVAVAGIPEPDYFFADSLWRPNPRSMWTIKTGENNIDKIEETLSKSDPNIGIQVKAGKATLDYQMGQYKIRWIASNKKSAGAADAKTTAMQERASAWIFRRALNDDVKYSAWTDIKLDKKYAELEKIYPNVDEDWLKVFFAQQERMLKEFSGNKFSEFNRDGGFMDYITKVVREKFGISKKDTWNPADIWCIQDESGVTRLIEQTVDGNGSQTILELNAVLRKLYRERKVVGISLKKVTGNVAKFEEVNVREDALNDDYNFDIKSYECKVNLKNGNEWDSLACRVVVGSTEAEYNFQIQGNDTTKDSNLKFEPTQKGAAAARMGKAPVDMVAKLIEDNNMKFENNHNKFPASATEFNKDVDEYKKLFSKLKKARVDVGGVTNQNDFVVNMQTVFANKPYAAKAKLMEMKFIESVLDLDPKKRQEFMTDMVFIAAKKGKRFGPFGKLY